MPPDSGTDSGTDCQTESQSDCHHSSYDTFWLVNLAWQDKMSINACVSNEVPQLEHFKSLWRQRRMRMQHAAGHGTLEAHCRPETETTRQLYG